MRTRHKTNYRGISYRLLDESNPEGERRYIVGFSDINGKWHTNTLPLGSTLRDARDLQASLRQRKNQGETLVRSKLVVSEMLDKWLESRRGFLAPKTIEVYEWAVESQLKPRIGNCRVQDLSASHLAQLRADMVSDGLKKWSIAKIETPLKNALAVAARDGLIHSSPFLKLLPHERVKSDQKEMRCLSKNEIERLLNGSSEKKWNALFGTLIFTGLRISEALSLTWEDLDFLSSLVHVRKSKTKAGERQIMLFPALGASLRRHKLSQAPGVQLVFCTRTGLPIGSRDVRKALYRAEAKADIPRYTPHELRHTFASILISQGRSLPFIAEQMGHSDPGITLKTYAHLYDAKEELKEAQERLQQTFGGMV